MYLQLKKQTLQFYRYCKEYTYISIALSFSQRNQLNKFSVTMKVLILQLDCIRRTTLVTITVRRAFRTLSDM